MPRAGHLVCRARGSFSTNDYLPDTLLAAAVGGIKCMIRNALLRSRPCSHFSAHSIAANLCAWF